MSAIIECIPNFSEGRREEIIETIADTIRVIKGVKLLDYSSDKSHNRSVFTFIGDPESVKKAAFASCKMASKLINMTKHSGGHPRMGATDVIPLVPIKDITVEECVKLSQELGKQIADELSIPVFLYEDSATKPERKNLATIRKGQFEGMAKKLQDPNWAPDFGTQKIHSTAGVVAVGTRMPLIAFNINLDISDITVADKIARTIRESSGGLKHVKAIGVMLEEQNIAQVSINMTNYKKTALHEVFEMVKTEAKRYNANITNSEIIGLVPMDALIDIAKYYLWLDGFNAEKQVLENYLFQ